MLCTQKPAALVGLLQVLDQRSSHTSRYIYRSNYRLALADTDGKTVVQALNQVGTEAEDT